LLMLVVPVPVLLATAAKKGEGEEAAAASASTDAASAEASVADAGLLDVSGWELLAGSMRGAADAQGKAARCRRGRWAGGRCTSEAALGSGLAASLVLPSIMAGVCWLKSAGGCWKLIQRAFLSQRTAMNPIRTALRFVQQPCWLSGTTMSCLPTVGLTQRAHLCTSQLAFAATDWLKIYIC
jgi:hypothetical protein